MKPRWRSKQRIEQIAWLFFLKIFDDREQEMELLRDDYKSPLPQHLRWSAWAADEEGITGDALLDFVNNTLLPKLKAMTGTTPMHALKRVEFENKGRSQQMILSALTQERHDEAVRAFDSLGGLETFRQHFPQ